MSQLSDKINHLFAEEKWGEARALIEKAMEKRRGQRSHFLLERLATTYYEEHQYEKAGQLINEALELAPRCPLVLWNYAGLLLALGEPREAIAICLSLLKRGPLAIAKEEGGEGLESAIGLLADCLFHVGVCLKRMRQWEKARQFFAGYADVVDAGAASIYTRLDLIKQMMELPQHRGSIMPTGKVRSARKALEQVSKQVLPLVG